jgi:Asp-tRNA(Asn)/Glu-tRNA(Gln) amidotransferase A subunit family amidase
MTLFSKMKFEYNFDHDNASPLALLASISTVTIFIYLQRIRKEYNKAHHHQSKRRMKTGNNDNSNITSNNHEELIVYNLEPISSPRATGLVLMLIPKLIRFPLIGTNFLNIIKKQNKFDEVKAFAATFTNRYLPLYYPLHEMSIEEQISHEEMIKSSPFSIEDIANLEPKGFDIHGKKDEDKTYFRHWSIYDFTNRYKTGKITPTQVIKQVIKRVSESKVRNPLIVLMDEEEVLREAAESTKRYKDGSPLGVLDGVPIAVKDEIPVLGYHVARGTCFMKEHVDADCPSIAKLRNQGAIIVGKTNQHELGLGTTGYNKFYGPPRNPYNDQHYTGGSSSGSSAAVSAGLVPLAIGTDGGGSIRIPAALCGVIGLKPTFKRIAEDFDLAPSVESIGPIAGCVNDAALAYSIMAGAETNDFRHQSRLQPDVHLYNFSDPPKSLEDIRIGFFKAHIEDSTPEMLNGTMKAINFFRLLGATIVEIELPNLHEIHLAHAVTILTEMCTRSSNFWETNKNDLTGEVQCSLELARSLSSHEFLAAQKVRSFAMEMIEDLFKTKMDILISPATASTAPKMEHDVLSEGESNLKLTTELMKYVVMGNFTGIPGIVFPVDYDDQTGLPVSILLQAAHWREDLLFRLSKVGEGLLPKGWKKPSGYIGSGLD